MGDAAADLALDDHGIDPHAHVLQGDVAQDLHLREIHIHLHFRHMGGVGIGQRFGLPFGVGLQGGIEPGRESVARRSPQHPRQLRQGD